MGGSLMPERRRDQLQKRALRALEAAREAARRARGSGVGPAQSGVISPSTPSTPPIERFTTERRMAERAAPPPVMQTTPPRPRRGQTRLNAPPPELRIPGQPVTPPASPPASVSASGALTGEEANLVELIDRLAAVADGSGLAEIEISLAGTRVLVRSRAAVTGSVPRTSEAPRAESAATLPPSAPVSDASPETSAAPAPASGVFVNAPLTGIFYAAASPGADPMVKVGDTVAVGQPIGLIEAMKLFNEIKSDKAGRVARVIAENGRIVKSKTPIIELES
jgi:acetyl-CoA carboxylase biotin carboxyl carrier protein